MIHPIGPQGPQPPPPGEPPSYLRQILNFFAQLFQGISSAAKSLNGWIWSKEPTPSKAIPHVVQNIAGGDAIRPGTQGLYRQLKRDWQNMAVFVGGERLECERAIDPKIDLTEKYLVNQGVVDKPQRRAIFSCLQQGVFVYEPLMQMLAALGTAGYESQRHTEHNAIALTARNGIASIEAVNEKTWTAPDGSLLRLQLRVRIPNHITGEAYYEIAYAGRLPPEIEAGLRRDHGLTLRRLEAPGAQGYFDHVQRSYHAGQGSCPEDVQYLHALGSWGLALGMEEAKQIEKELRAKKSPLTPFERELKVLVGVLNDATLSEKDIYRKIVRALRKALTLADQTTPLHQLAFLRAFAYCRFTGVSLYPYLKELERRIGGEWRVQLTMNNFTAEFERRNALQNHLPAAFAMDSGQRKRMKLRGWAGVAFDPLLHRNIPYVEGDLQLPSGRPVRLLRHGTPIETSTYGRTMEITPDYLAFVRAAADQHQNVLHVAFEDADKSKPGCPCDEGPRLQKRMELAKEPNVFPIALRLDGPLFNPAHKLPPSEVKSRLIDALDTSTVGFVVTDQCKLSKQELEQWIGEVQDRYFRGKEEFANKAEHQAFLLLCYAHIVLKLCEKHHIDFLEAACKDDIDRGNTFKAILKLHHLHLTNSLTPENLESIMVHLLGAPLVVKKQGVIRGRKEYVGAVLNVLQSVEPTGAPPPASYRVYNPQQALSSASDPLALGCHAGTQVSYQSYLRGLQGRGLDVFRSLSDATTPLQQVKQQMDNTHLEYTLLATPDPHYLPRTLYPLTRYGSDKIVVGHVELKERIGGYHYRYIPLATDQRPEVLS